MNLLCSTYDQRTRTLSPENDSLADFENPTVGDAAAAVDPVRVGGGGAAAAAEAPGKNSVEKFRLQF